MNIPGKRRIFTSNYTGLGNRLEGLTLSFAIQQAYGHEICLDWPELDALEVLGTVQRKMWPWDRIGSIKIFMCDDALFKTLGMYRAITQRAVYCPESVPERLYLETARKIRLKEPYVETIRKFFGELKDRPVVGVHVRGGDFTMVDEQTYDMNRARHQAVPMWWYEHVMRQYRAAFPDVAFLLCHSGDPKRFDAWRAEFDTFELPPLTAYGGTRTQHQSAGHPVADLFALACCNVIIATPNSSFSHFAASALGHPATMILPPSLVSADKPASGYVQLYGQRLPVWVGAAANSAIFRLVENASGLPAPARARTDWINDPSRLPAPVR